jgi:hypothetical protein
VEFAVVVALIGYVGTMAVALFALVAAWFAVIGPPSPAAHQPPRQAIGEIGRTAALQAQPGTPQPGPWGPAVVHRADDATAATEGDDARAAAEQAAAEKAKQIKLARQRKRQEQLARQRQEQQDRQQDWQYAEPSSQSYSTALGYDREGGRDRSPPPAFNAFGPRRF